jgi:ubiquinone/menaquinone biosynthesis C-methylase UbiE
MKGFPMTTTDFDQTKADAFAGSMLGVVNAASTALGLSIGHRLGLLDTLAGMAPSTSQQIADAAHLQERYVREWLNGMVVAKVVEYDPSAQSYHLPAEHAAVTRAAGPRNIANFTQFIPLLSSVEGELIDAFRNGGGVPYSSYEAFHGLMRENSAARFDHNLIDTQIPLVDGIVAKLEAGIAVADMGCGSGHAINLMAQQWPNSQFTGQDFSEQALGVARAEATAMGLQNATFELSDVAALSGENLYDLVTTFDAVHDQADPAGMLASVARVLKPGGTYLCADIAASSNVHENMEHLTGPFFYTVSLFHCMTVSLALDGEGLGAMWGEQRALEMLADAGFTNVEVKQVDGDLFNNFYIATPA